VGSTAGAPFNERGNVGRSFVANRAEAHNTTRRWLAETGFAAGYFLKRFDLIPDHVPEIGLADDALILQRVIERNQSELHRGLAKSIDLAADNSS